MADLICRNTMMRCNTPGMCSPHGGCRPAQDQSARIAELERECERLRKEVDKRIKQGQDNHEMLNGVLRQNAELRGELSVLRSSEAHELGKVRAELEACRKDAEYWREYSRTLEIWANG